MALTSAPQTFTINVAGAADYAITNTGGVLTITDNSGLSENLTFRKPRHRLLPLPTPEQPALLASMEPPTPQPTGGSISSAGITRVVINAGGGNNSIQIGPFVDTLPSLEVNGGAGR